MLRHRKLVVAFSIITLLLAISYFVVSGFGYEDFGKAKFSLQYSFKTAPSIVGSVTSILFYFAIVMLVLIAGLTKSASANKASLVISMLSLGLYALGTIASFFVSNLYSIKDMPTQYIKITKYNDIFGRQWWIPNNNGWTAPVLRWCLVLIFLFALLSLLPSIFKRTVFVVLTSVALMAYSVIYFIDGAVIKHPFLAFSFTGKSKGITWWSYYAKNKMTLYTVSEALFSILLLMLAFTYILIAVYRTKYARVHEEPAMNVAPFAAVPPMNGMPPVRPQSFDYTAPNAPQVNAPVNTFNPMSNDVTQEINIPAETLAAVDEMPIPRDEEPAAEGSVCPNCGKALKPGVVFCAGCGTKVQ